MNVNQSPSLFNGNLPACLLLLLAACFAGLMLGGMQERTKPDPGKVIGISCVQTKSGSNVVIYRLWSNGGIDRRLVRSVGTTPEDTLTHQNGWRMLPNP